MSKEINKDQISNIRSHYDEGAKKLYFSVVDVIGLVTKTSDPRNYWKVLKSRLKNEHKELVTRCNQLKMRASDGKTYLTDVGDKETILEIIELVSPENVPPFREWFESLEPQPEAGQPSAEEFEPEFELRVDAYRTLDSFMVEAMVAGLEIKNIFISVTANTITIRGSREKLQDTSYVIQDLYWGKFSRTITLPDYIDVNQVEAEMSYGLLTIKLPLLQKDRERIIKITLRD